MPAMRTPFGTTRGAFLRSAFGPQKRTSLWNRNRRERVTEELSGIEMRHHPQLVGGDVPPELLDDGLGLGPGAVAVGIVGLHHDVLDADAVARVDRRRVVDRAEPEVALQRLSRAVVGPEAAVDVARAVDDVVEPVEEHRDPADATFAHGDVEAGGAVGPSGPEVLGAGRER